MNQDIRTEIPRSQDAARFARQFVAGQLGERLTREQRDDLLLVTSELATNAYQHGGGKIELRLRVREAEVTVEVLDQGPPAHVRIRPAGEDGGWGLRIVDGLAEDWGVFEGTTHVWATLPIG